MASRSKKNKKPPKPPVLPQIKQLKKVHSALVEWIKLISFSFSGILLLFLGDYFSGIFFLGYPFALFPVIVLGFASLLLLPLFNSITSKWVSLNKRLWAYPGLWCLALMMIYSAHGFLQGNLTVDALRPESGHCSALTHLMIRNKSQTQILDAFVKQLSPMKQYAYFFAEQNCKANRIYQAIRVRPLTLCGVDLTRSPYDCFASLMNQKVPDERKSVIETALDHRVGMELLDSQPLLDHELDRQAAQSELLLLKLEHTLFSLHSLKDRKMPQEWIPTLKNTTSDQIHERIDLAKRVDTDEWERIVLDFFLGKLTQLGEAALVFWLDDRFAASCQAEYLDQASLMISKLDPILLKMRNLASSGDPRVKHYLELKKSVNDVMGSSP